MSDIPARHLLWPSRRGMEVRSVETVVQMLNEANVRYLIVGGLAVNAHGYERHTADIDLVIGLQPENIERGLKALFSVGYRIANPVTAEDFADVKKREVWRKEKGMVVLKLWSDVHRRTPIDVFVYEPFNFQQEYDAAYWVELSDHLKAPMVRYQTLLEMKRDAGRPQDIADVADLERVRQLREDDNDEQQE